MGSGKSTLARTLLRSAPQSNRVLIIDTLNEYDGETTTTLYELASRLTAPTFRLAFRPFDMNEIDYAYGLALNAKNLTILHDEIDLVCSAGYTPKHLSNMIRRGRHYKIDLIACTRRPSEISRLLSSQAGVIYAFKVSEPRDLEYFTKMCGQDRANKIQHLPLHGYLRIEG